mmetsp:Transcript_23423/g.67496  ORF Transcript_23423/g.67496 Transcript_23423/m.67496 type:complete len:85 (-) Transcript_23423:1356-1610(-)
MLSGEVVASCKKHGAAKDADLLADAKIAPGIIFATTIAVDPTAPRGNIMTRMTTTARLETRLGQLTSLEKLGELFTSAIGLMDG